MAASPCILTKHDLGRVMDKRPEWREQAVFARDEVEALISDERVPSERRFLWALFALAGLRHGEAAGLRWRHVDLDVKPLGRLTVATSYDRGRTKTGGERRVPVHPTLAAMFAERRLHEWEARQGYRSEADDLVVPSANGKMRHKSNTLRFLALDLRAGLRGRRVHDFRRTFISLASEDGADPYVMKLATHARPKDVYDLYTSVPWERCCTEMAKLRVQRRQGGNVVPLWAACYSGLDSPRLWLGTAAG